MPFVANKSEIREWVIYKITSPSGRTYIGITSNFKNRMDSYKNCDKRLYKQTAVYYSIRKYGHAAHLIEIIDIFSGNNMYAQGKEMFWIRTYMSNKNKYPVQNGLNLTDGGDGTIGYKATPEAIEKNRKSKLGHKQSAETIEKRRQKLVGRKMNFTHLTPEFRKKISERVKGFKHTQEALRKISEASKGNKHRLGIKMTPEQIEHRSSLLRGQKKSPENLKKHIEMVYRVCGRPILQYDLKGNFIKEYPMVTSAAKELGIPKLGIHRNLSGKYKQSRGFIFKYKQNATYTKFQFVRRTFNFVECNFLGHQHWG